MIANSPLEGCACLCRPRNEKYMIRAKVATYMAYSIYSIAEPPATKLTRKRGQSGSIRAGCELISFWTIPMRPGNLKHALEWTYADVVENRPLQLMAARSSIYFIFSLLLALPTIFVAAAHWPAFAALVKLQNFIMQFLPAGVTGLLQRATVSPQQRTFLWVGIAATFLLASSGFSALIDALNLAFEAGDDRSFWHTRLLALALIFTSGLFLLFALAIVLTGPRLGAWLALRLPPANLLWPYLRWIIPAILILLAVEALYFLGPNVKQRVLATLPGVLLAAGACIGFSALVEMSIRQFENFHSAYVTLGVSILLMVLWLNWTGLAMLVGAALNLELSKLSPKGKLQEKHTDSSHYTKLDLIA